MTGAETTLLIMQGLSLIIRLANDTKEFADMLSRAQAEGRDLTPEEMSKIRNSRLSAMVAWNEEGKNGTSENRP